jgi:hypothetical protein
MNINSKTTIILTLYNLQTEKTSFRFNSYYERFVKIGTFSPAPPPPLLVSFNTALRPSVKRDLISNLNPYFSELHDLKKKVTDNCYFKGNAFFYILHLHLTYIQHIIIILF